MNIQIQAIIRDGIKLRSTAYTILLMNLCENAYRCDKKLFRHYQPCHIILYHNVKLQGSPPNRLLVSRPCSSCDLSSSQKKKCDASQNEDPRTSVGFVDRNCQSVASRCWDGNDPIHSPKMYPSPSVLNNVTGSRTIIFL